MSEQSNTTYFNYNLPQPEHFHITEPEFERGLWCFWLTADRCILEFVNKIYCIMEAPHHRVLPGRQLEDRTKFAINPRYNHQEIWKWLCQVLEVEARHIMLDAQWEDAILDAIGIDEFE